MHVKRKFVEGSVEAGEPVVSHLEIRTGPEVGERQKFSPRVIQRGIVEGWLSFGGGKAVVTTAPDLPDMELQVVAGPGLRCCFCEAELTDEAAARNHVLDEHEASGKKDAFELHVLEDAVDDEGAPMKRSIRSGFVKSPDPENPAGYRGDNFYLLERVS